MSHLRYLFSPVCLLSLALLAVPTLPLVGLLFTLPTSLFVYLLILFFVVVFFFLFADALLLFSYNIPHKAFVDRGDVCDTIRLISQKIKIPSPSLLIVPPNSRWSKYQNEELSVLPIRGHKRSMIVINQEIIEKLSRPELTAILSLTIMKLKDKRLIWIEFFSFLMDLIFVFPKRLLLKRLGNDQNKITTTFIRYVYILYIYVYEIFIFLCLIGSFLVVKFLGHHLFKRKESFLQDMSSTTIGAGCDNFTLVTALSKIQTIESNILNRSNLYLNLSPVGLFAGDHMLLNKQKRTGFCQLLKTPLRPLNLLEVNEAND